MKAYIKPNTQVIEIVLQQLMTASDNNDPENVSVFDTEVSGDKALSRGGSLWNDDDE